MNQPLVKNGENAAKVVLDLLEKKDALSPTGRLIIERYMRSWNCDVLVALTETHLLKESLLAQKLAEGFGLPLTRDLLNYRFVMESLEVLPFILARSWEMILVSQGEEGWILVVANPACEGRIAQVRKGLSLGFTLSVGERSDIVRAIDELYPLAAQLPSLHAE